VLVGFSISIGQKQYSNLTSFMQSDIHVNNNQPPLLTRLKAAFGLQILAITETRHWWQGWAGITTDKGNYRT